MTSNYGVKLQWDGIKTLKIIVPGTDDFKDNVCGLCGNFDDDVTNDLFLGRHTDEVYTGENFCPQLLAHGTPGDQVVYVYEL